MINKSIGQQVHKCIEGYKKKKNISKMINQQINTQTGHFTNQQMKQCNDQQIHKYTNQQLHQYTTAPLNQEGDKSVNQ